MELPTIGIDVAKDTLDVSVVTGGKALAKQFDNTTAGCAGLVGPPTSSRGATGLAPSLPPLKV